MIKAFFYRNSDGLYKGFSVSGHAGYADSGKDICCAAVSALTINTVNSLDKLTDCDMKVEQDKNGSIKLKLLIIENEKAQLLIDSLRLGLTGIYKEYGDKYLQLYFKEV